MDAVVREYFKEYYEIYEEALKSEVDNAPGYLVSYRPLQGKSSFIAIDTEWIGFDNKMEVRQASLVDPIKTMSHFKLINYPLSIVENTAELTTFLGIGGHAIVSKNLAETNWQEILRPKVVTKTYGEGYIDYETIPDKYKKRFARGNYRIEIFDRDNYQCRICGASPDDSVHVRLEAHHIKPWEEGGVTEPENLITLCSTCHEGAKFIDRGVLYKKIGLCFPHEKHKLYKQNSNWTRMQQSSFDQLIDNSITLKINNRAK